MKRTPFKRSGKPLKRSAKTLKNKLWAIFSLWVRRKDADQNGMVSCISCGVIKHFSEMHCGHFIPKSLGLSIYFEERNNSVQCPSCNVFRHGNLSSYAVALRKKYGETILEELDTQRQQIRKISQVEYEELIETYKKKLAELN